MFVRRLASSAPILRICRIPHRPAFVRMSSDESIPADGAVAKLGAKDVKSVSDEDWKTVLSPEAFNVTRQAGTEPKFSGKYDKFFKEGKYNCICCGADLFVSDAKFDSGCGWPAFSKSVEGDKNIVRIPDHSYGYERTEVRCKQCNAHLGHVFDDGPKETGERYCINSVAINFLKKDA